MCALSKFQLENKEDMQREGDIYKRKLNSVSSKSLIKMMVQTRVRTGIFLNVVIINFIKVLN